MRPLYIVPKRVYMEICIASWVTPANRIYVYTYICIYNVRRPIYMCDMVSHLNFPRLKGAHYMDRSSRGIYAASFWYIYDAFSLVYINKDTLWSTNIEEQRISVRNKGQQKDRSFRNGPLQPIKSRIYFILLLQQLLHCCPLMVCPLLGVRV
jgi:hypothetical protein